MLPHALPPHQPPGPPGCGSAGSTQLLLPVVPDSMPPVLHHPAFTPALAMPSPLEGGAPLPGQPCWAPHGPGAGPAGPAAAASTTGAAAGGSQVGASTRRSPAQRRAQGKPGEVGTEDEELSSLLQVRALQLPALDLLAFVSARGDKLQGPIPRKVVRVIELLADRNVSRSKPLQSTSCQPASQFRCAPQALGVGRHPPISAPAPAPASTAHPQAAAAAAAAAGAASWGAMLSPGRPAAELAAAGGQPSPLPPQPSCEAAALAQQGSIGPVPADDEFSRLLSAIVQCLWHCNAFWSLVSCGPSR
jgi:hypothetical protein